MADPYSSHDPDSGSEWTKPMRAAGREAAAAAQLPDKAVEVWRHTDTGRIPFEGLAVAATAPADDEVLRAAAAVGERCALMVTWQGGARVIEDGAPGVELGPLADLSDDAAGAAGVGTIVAADADLFCALNAAHWEGGAAVSVAAGARPEAPIVIVHWGAASGTVTFGRTFVGVGTLADATVVEMWVGPGGAAGSLTAPVGEIVVDDGARLSHVALQHLGDDATFVATQRARLGRDGRITTTAAALGARTHRLDTATELVGDGSTSDALGVYVADGERHVDFRATQRHVGTHCTSDLLYRGAAWDRASAVFSGLIRIEPSAAHSDAHQASHYLLLSEDARAANIPNLEILNHDVKCGHASSGGPPDEDQLYYLAARGIAPAAAERLVVDGFFADVAARVPVPAVGAHIVSEVGRRLAVLRGDT